MRKVVLISTKEPPTWESWRELKGRENPNRARLTMTQQEALTILQEVLAAPSIDVAVQLLKAKLPTRKAFTYWLGQVGHRQDVRLGKGKGFVSYVRAVLESFSHRGSVNEVPSERKEKEEMAKKDQRPVVITRKGAHKNGSTMSEGTTEETHSTVEDRNTYPVSNEEMTLGQNGPEKLQESERKGESSSDTPPEDKPATSVSKVQEYARKTLLTYADCAVQKEEEGILHVLGRNFEDKGLLNFWLWKAGYGELSKLIRNKDLFDSLRIISRELYRDMKATIGKPIARW
jgi:hypothetical protein